ncbi:efflux RND transporter periplasmic adaptor subunit [Chondrinema litorale]|uniref:efflux RND transporter periplasmic adaptor subunit n=1 Tax=Chondrinema litorale TaxID=2994555 RepID=UPI002542D7CE|nr:efflux RND transporter periplasmic adaptor subunit [Chondrinema litorale]UZR97349.1 efflux RND transporter periplasmic adaptor subunit [Chondrinema litorale]
MKLYFQPLTVFLFISCWLAACSAKKSPTEEDVNKRVYLEEKNPVSVLVLDKGTFSKQLVSNGKLHALKKSELSFSSDGVVSTLPYKNGSSVQKGSIIAQLQQQEQKLSLAEAKIAIEKARLELEDFLIGQGYDLKDSTNIPDQLFETSKIRTGYTEAQQQLSKAEQDFNNTVLIAPFSGKIASLSNKLYEHPTGEAPFCILIDDSSFEVEFQVTESEFHELTVGLGITVVPFASNEKFEGTITAINPLVDEHGLITIQATVKNTGGLLEGMNVKVLIEQEVSDQYVVPKAAVVIRQNQDVLFKVVDGKAYWTYLQILYENSDSYAVVAHPDKQASLEVGDTVIISGNLNLAHESEVAVQ